MLGFRVIMNYVIPKSVTAEKLIFPYCHKNVMDI